MLVHKGLLVLKDKLALPVKLRGDFPNPIGRVDLTIRKDASICQLLAKDEYMPDLGARSLRHGVNLVREWVYEKYLDMEGPIEESGPVQEMALEVHNKNIKVRVGGQRASWESGHAGLGNQG